MTEVLGRKGLFRLIQPPLRSTRAGSGILLLCVVLLSSVSFSERITAWAVLASLLLVVTSVLTREIQALHLSCFSTFFVALPYLLPSLPTWPYLLLIPLFCYAAVVLAVPSLRTSLGWLRPGRVTGAIVLFALTIAVMSGIALYAWYRVLTPDLTIHLGHFPDMPVWLFPLAGLGFSLGNAALEELVYRGVIMQTLDSAAGPGLVSLAGQAWLFGALHYREGFPSGVVGLAMTVIYGIMLGALRRRSEGMVAPWMAHVAADVVIFIILAGIVLKKTG